ncbi:pullulanase [Bacillus sp. PS06]|nr:pullulanase [Bacillus sp. PS06]
MTITSHTVEKLIDPTGILIGDRFEYILNIDVPEDDELYSDHGLKIKAIYAVNQSDARLVQYYIIEKVTEAVQDFELEEEEEQIIAEYCKLHLPIED